MQPSGKLYLSRDVADPEAVELLKFKKMLRIGAELRQEGASIILRTGAKAPLEKLL